MSRWARVFTRVGQLENEARAMMDRLHSRDVAGDCWRRMILGRARESAYGARFGARNYPRLLQAEQELRTAVERGKAFDDALWSV